MILEFHLKTGEMFKGRVPDDHRLSPESLTASVLHKICDPKDKYSVLVQGDNISHVINRGETN